MRRLFELRVPGLGADFEPLDVSADALHVGAQVIEFPPLPQDGLVKLLEIVLDVHQERFDRMEPIQRSGVVRHRG